MDNFGVGRGETGMLLERKNSFSSSVFSPSVFLLLRKGIFGRLLVVIIIISFFVYPGSKFEYVGV